MASAIPDGIGLLTLFLKKNGLHCVVDDKNGSKGLIVDVKQVHRFLLQEARCSSEVGNNDCPSKKKSLPAIGNVGNPNNNAAVITRSAAKPMVHIRLTFAFFNCLCWLILFSNIPLSFRFMSIANYRYNADR